MHETVLLSVDDAMPQTLRDTSPKKDDLHLSAWHAMMGTMMELNMQRYQASHHVQTIPPT